MLMHPVYRPVNSIALAHISGLTRQPSTFVNVPRIARPGLHGMGLGFTPLPDISSTEASDAGNQILNGVEMGLNAVPVVGPVASTVLTVFANIAHTIESWFGIGSGRREADLITPTQNRVGDALGQIMNQLAPLEAHPSYSNLPALENLYRQLWQVAVTFKAFVERTDVFHDGRASQQALNGIMPQIDGSCGYHWPPPMRATQNSNCEAFGVMWGTGLLGRIVNAIKASGGTSLPTVQPATGGQMPNVTALPTGSTLFAGLGGNTALAALGILALALYARRSRG